MAEIDIDLIRGLREQSPKAQRQALERYGNEVFAMVARMLPAAEDAEEVYQDVFVKALQGIGNYDSRKASLATWLNRIAYHEALNFVRKRHPNIVYMDEKDMNLGNDETPEEDVHDSQTIQALENAMEKLPPHEQAIVTMFYYDDMSLADIAYVTGSNPSTVGSQLCRIRKKLYRIIKTTHQ